MKFCILSIALTAVLFPAIAHALVPTQAKLAQQDVSPKCLGIETDEICGQAGGTGTCSSGPAVKITNFCASGIVIDSVKTSEKGAAELKPVTQVDALLVTSEKTLEYVFATDPAICKEAGEKIDKEYAAEKERLFQQKKKYEEDKAKGEIDPLIQWQEDRNSDWYLPEKREQAACGKITLATGDALTVSIPWGMSYEISGYSDEGKEKNPAIRVAGKMINPQTPPTSRR